MNHLRRGCVLLGFFIFIAGHAHAADIRLATNSTGRPLAGITIEGEIVEGDYQRFRALVLSTKGANTVWLASLGGNFSEALRIGRLVRALSLAVWAPMFHNRPLVALTDNRNNTCASSCFFIYIAGANRHGSIIGVHRPFLAREQYASMGLDQAAKAHLRIKDQTAEYLEEMDVPPRYLSMIMSADSGEISWLSKEDITRDFDGFIDQYDEWFRANCPTLSQFQISEDEKLRQRVIRGEPLTEQELAFRAEVDGVIEARLECTGNRLEEVQERSRQHASK